MEWARRHSLVPARAPDLASSVVLGSPETFTRFDPTGQFWLTRTLDGTAALWRGNLNQPERLATIVFFQSERDWAVMSPDGRYDSSRGGDVTGLYWVVGNQPRNLSELKAQYYHPGLLAELLGVFQDIPEAPESDPTELEAAKTVESLGGNIVRDDARRQSSHHCQFRRRQGDRRGLEGSEYL